MLSSCWKTDMAWRSGRRPPGRRAGAHPEPAIGSLSIVELAFRQTISPRSSPRFPPLPPPSLPHKRSEGIIVGRARGEYTSADIEVAAVDDRLGPLPNQ